MAKRKRSWLALVLLLAVVLYLLLERQERPRQRRQAPTLGQVTPVELFHGIPPEGTGGDPLLNRQKNRSQTPLDLRPYSIDEIQLLPHDALEEAGSKNRSGWGFLPTEQARRYEALGVQVEGYLIRAKRSGVESCNGYNDSLRDFHLWLAGQPAARTSEAIIAEITPRFAEVHSDWTINTFTDLARKKAKVRVSGWLLWDEEHPSEVGKSRASQWEIHPVTEVEVFTHGKWIRLRESPLP